MDAKTLEFRQAVYEYLRTNLTAEIHNGTRYDDRPVVTVRLVLCDPSDGKYHVISESTTSL